MEVLGERSEFDKVIPQCPIRAGGAQSGDLAAREAGRGPRGGGGPALSAAATAATPAAAWGGLFGAAFGHAATLPSPDCAGHHFDHASGRHRRFDHLLELAAAHGAAKARLRPQLAARDDPHYPLLPRDPAPKPPSREALARVQLGSQLPAAGARHAASKPCLRAARAAPATSGRPWHRRRRPPPCRQAAVAPAPPRPAAHPPLRADQRLRLTP